MQKILFVSSKNLSIKNFDGAQKRSYEIVESLSRKNKIDFIFASNKAKIIETKICRKILFFKINFFERLVNILISMMKLEPLQNGFFLSRKMKKYILENKDDYDVIIFHMIRCAQYLPGNFYGKKILEMTDLMSKNYKMVAKELSFYNPLKYVYFFEMLLLKHYEKKISKKFDKIVFVSQHEYKDAKKFIPNNKIINVSNSYKTTKMIYNFKAKNYKIIFVGNINYTPNKIACYDFSKNVLPIIKKKYSSMEFHIVGKINLWDRFLLSKYDGVKIYGQVEKLDKIFSNGICGICNLKVTTGIQNKIFTYMSYGLPVIASQNSFPKKLLKKNQDLLVYKNSKYEIVKNIIKLKENKKLSVKISKNSFKKLKNSFNKSKTYIRYNKIVN
tara:strand:- start:28995 stop:30155 length:1161 start_codon:yes stop_codon:yes gene_type:complete